MEAWESIEEEEEEEQWSSSTTWETESGDNESHHHQPLDTLQHLLPIRRGISKFYDGKSKSFTSLADASSYESVKDIAKPENVYSRRRRNLMAFKEKTRNFPSSGISKRIISSTPSTVPLAYGINYDSTSSCTSEDSTSSSNPRSPPPSASATTATIKMPSSSPGREAPHPSS